MANPSIECTARSFKLAFPPGSTVDIEPINAAILESVQVHGIDAVLARTGDDREVTLRELAESGFSEDIPSDKEVVKVLTFDFKDDSLFAASGDVKVPLARLKLTVGYRSAEGNSKVTQDGAARDYIADVFVVTKSEAAPA